MNLEGLPISKIIPDQFGVRIIEDPKKVFEEILENKVEVGTVYSLKFALPVYDNLGQQLYEIITLAVLDNSIELTLLSPTTEDSDLRVINISLSDMQAYRNLNLDQVLKFILTNEGDFLTASYKLVEIVRVNTNSNL